MSVTNRLVFDPTDVDTIGASSSIGAFVRAGDDGALIGHVSDALKVNFSNTSIAVTATDLDIRDLAFATDSVDVSGSSVSITGSVAVTATDLDIRDLAFATDSVDVSGSAVSITGSVAVTATDLDIRDLDATLDFVSSWTKDGSGNAITSTGAALDVNIKSGDLDDSLANTAIENESRTVGGTAIATTVASAIAGRKWLYLANVSNKEIYFGKAGVTLANGFPIYPGDKHEFRVGASVVTNVIGNGTGLDLRVMQMS